MYLVHVLCTRYTTKYYHWAIIIIIIALPLLPLPPPPSSSSSSPPPPPPPLPSRHIDEMLFVNRSKHKNLISTWGFSIHFPLLFSTAANIQFSQLAFWMRDTAYAAANAAVAVATAAAVIVYTVCVCVYVYVWLLPIQANITVIFWFFTRLIVSLFGFAHFVGIKITWMRMRARESGKGILCNLTTGFTLPLPFSLPRCRCVAVVVVVVSCHKHKHTHTHTRYSSYRPFQQCIMRAYEFYV